MGGSEPQEKNGINQDEPDMPASPFNQPMDPIAQPVPVSMDNTRLARRIASRFEPYIVYNFRSSYGLGCINNLISNFNGIKPGRRAAAAARFSNMGSSERQNTAAGRAPAQGALVIVNPASDSVEPESEANAKQWRDKKESSDSP